MIRTVLEPSAGKGDIVDFVKEKYKEETWNRELDIDCIEIDDKLQKIFRRKGFESGA